jgi:hypothetical protein
MGAAREVAAAHDVLIVHCGTLLFQEESPLRPALIAMSR